MQLFLPTGGTPPYQAVIYVPHAGFTMRRVESSQLEPTDSAQPLDFILKSGRALIVVALEGSFERAWPPARRASMSYAERYRVRLRHGRQDVGRVIDYLETRQDIDAGRLGWFGVSWGAQGMTPILAVEPRFRSVVLDGGGVFLFEIPDAEQFYNYLPRITQPVLMLNGRWDIDVNPDAQRRFFELLGTPADQKKHMRVRGGTWQPAAQSPRSRQPRVVRQVSRADATDVAARLSVATLRIENGPASPRGARAIHQGAWNPAAR